MNALTLYQAEENLQTLVDSEALLDPQREADLMAECAAELTIASEEAITKRDNVGRFIKACEAAIDARKAEAARLVQEATFIETKLKFLKTTICEAVRTFGTIAKGQKSPKLIGNVFTLMAKVNSQGALQCTTHETPSERPDISRVKIYLPLDVARRLADHLQMQPAIADSLARESDWDMLRRCIDESVPEFDEQKIRRTLQAGFKVDGFSIHTGHHLEVK